MGWRSLAAAVAAAAAMACPAWAQVRELPVSAGSCAIFHALTGQVRPGCSAPAAAGGALGLPRSAAAAGRGAAPLGSDPVNQGYYIRFAFNSDALTPEYAAHLERLAAVLRAPQLAGACIRLTGHTDAVGPAGYNMALSRTRAQTVAGFLSGPGGIDTARIEAIGAGKMAHLPGYPDTHALQRRVEILARPGGDEPCTP